jgi:hypothetical protein
LYKVGGVFLIGPGQLLLGIAPVRVYFGHHNYKSDTVK